MCLSMRLPYDAAVNAICQYMVAVSIPPYMLKFKYVEAAWGGVCQTPTPKP